MRLRGVVGLVALVLLVVIGVVIVRTFAYKPGGSATGSVALAPAVPIDIDRAAAHLGEAIRFKTISHQDPAEDDAKAWDDQRAWLAATYPRLHALARRDIVGGGALLYTWAGSDPSLAPIILMAHQDVVPVSEGTERDWTAPPFSGALQGGSIWGRGAVEDKGSLVAIMEAAETLAAQGFKPKRSIIIVSGEHEETSGGSIPQVVALLAARGVHALYVLDEGLTIINDNPLTGKPAALIGTAEKGYATLKVAAKGIGGHSSTPPPSTTVVTLAKAVTAIADHPFAMKLEGVPDQMIRSLSSQMSFTTRMAMANRWLFGPLIISKFAASPAGAAQLHTTIAPTMLRGSPKENVLPQEADAWINYRILPGQTTGDVLARAKAAVGGLPVTFSWVGQPHDPSGVASLANPGYRAIAALAADMEQAPAAPGLMIAATDSYKLGPIAQDIYKFQFIRMDLTATEMIHGTNEHMTLANMQRLTQFFARLMATTAG